MPKPTDCPYVRENDRQGAPGSREPAWFGAWEVAPGAECSWGHSALRDTPASAVTCPLSM